MTEPMSEYERRLAERLQGWTEAAARGRDHVADARELLVAEETTSTPSHRLRLALAIGTVATAVAVAAIVVSVVQLRPLPASSPSPAISSSSAPAASPSPQPVPGAEIDLADHAWYTLVPVAFGSFTEPGPGDPPLPDPYDLLSLGTLDGQVTAQLELTSTISEDGLEGAWANGPYGRAVLAGDDDGTRSRVFIVSALDGTDHTLFEIDDVVVIGALAEEGGFVYFVPVDRQSRVDRGLWRAPLEGGDAEVLFEGPISEAANDYASNWTMEWSAHADVLVTQVCRVRECQTLAHVVDSGESQLDSGASKLVGVTDAAYVTQGEIVSLATGDARPLRDFLPPQVALAGAKGEWYVVSEPEQSNPRAYAMVAAPLDGGALKTLVEVGAAEPTQATLKVRPDSGADLPPGWILRWPTEGTRYMDIAVPPHVWYAGELVNVVSGERLTVPPTRWPEAVTDCQPIAPPALPSGVAAGEPIVTPGGRYTWATWGAGSDQVVQIVGGWLYGITEPGQGGELESQVTIRGQSGRVLPMGSADGPWAIVWEEGGCRYEVQLVPGTTQAETVEYAERYVGPTLSTPLVVPAAVAQRAELPWCGHEVMDRRPEGDFYDADIRACFLDAWEAGEAAEFVSDTLTPEAGRVRTMYRSLGDGQLEVLLDTTQDPLSARRWTRVACTSIRHAYNDPAGTPVFMEDDCGEQEIVIPTGSGLGPTPDEIRMIENLMVFARRPDQRTMSDIPFAADVALGLSDELLARRELRTLGDPNTWMLDAEAFRERVGPFSVLDVLANWNVHPGQLLIREAQVAVGPHPHCASPPVPPPDEVADLRRISVQPVGAIPCLSWWTVDLFLTDDGRIAAVTLDFGEP